MRMESENPEVAKFIKAALEDWMENPPRTLGDQLAVLLINLLTLVEAFRRQEEVDRLKALVEN